MKVCPRCYAVLWHREDKTEAELVARRLQALAERDRKRQERMVLHLASKADREPKP